MEWMIPIAVVLVLLAVVAAWLKSPRAAAAEFPYTKNRGLFSPAERSFFGVLAQAVGDEYHVFGKVRVADVVSVRPLRNRSAWQRAFNRISAKHFDFVLCDKDDLSVIAVVELDDRSHQQGKRQARDSFLAELCETISLPLIRVPAKDAYTVGEIRRLVDSALATPRDSVLEGEVPLNGTTEPSAPGKPDTGDVRTPKGLASEAEPSTPLCPKCAAPMVRREAKSGANAGQAFWGCSAFPKCRGIIKVST